MRVEFAYVFTAGLVAAVNPCGFPMLPAYLSYFIGLDDDEAGTSARVVRAIASAGAVSLGFVAVFGVLGIPINAGVTSIYDVMPWLTIVIGALLVVLGALMLRGWKPVVALPRLDRGGRTRRLGSMVLFGVSYAITSLGCTLPVFLLVVTGPATGTGALAKAASFLTYALGMAVVMTALSLALALARESLVRALRNAVRYVDRASGALLVLVGLYLIWYGRFAMDPANGTATAPYGRVEEWSDSARAWIGERGAGFGVAVGTIVLVALGLAVWWTRRSPVGVGEPEPAHDPGPTPVVVGDGE